LYRHTALADWVASEYEKWEHGMKRKEEERMNELELILLSVLRVAPGVPGVHCTAQKGRHNLDVLSQASLISIYIIYLIIKIRVL
jgi:hypothetical protein